ncbi:MAG TPA: FtsX-like permease family protein [Burkholderiales bacterium]|nr:FtsX-like permease family protein [Burkholderiales bacterium]
MNIASLSASYLRARPLQTLLSLVLLSLGVATIVLLVLVVAQLEERMGRDARGIDLVVGAKGSPMQLMLAGIYHLDAPTGNIPLESFELLRKNRFVKKAIPLALGDGWKGYRIVGAPKDYIDHYGARFSAGRFYEKTMEAVLGAEVAARTGANVGDKFVGAHGMGGQGEEHGERPYTVVGILSSTGSVLDRLVLTSIDSVWHVHEEHQGPQDDADRKAMEEDREVTVILVQYASPLAAATLPRQINSQSELQAASPAYETARLFRIVGVGVEAMRGFALLLMLAAGLSVFIALYTALEERRYDLAIMRTLGASPRRLFGLLLVEGIVLAVLGAVIGLVVGHGLASVLGAWLASQQQYPVTGLEWRPEELWVLAAALAIGIAAALLPAWRAYRTDVSRTLAQA